MNTSVHLTKLLLFFSIFLLFPNVYALNTSDIQFNHCPNDCGKVLIGSAKVYPESIRWVGAQKADTFYLSTGSPFGFTGSILYNGESPPDGTENKWKYEAIGMVVMGFPEAVGRAPAVGFFFAPLQAGETTFTNNYYAQASGELIKLPVPVKGTGVGDDEMQPALTLEIGVEGQSGQQLCQGQNDTTQCEEILVSPNSGITFTLTPRLNSEAMATLMANNPDLSDVSHALIQTNILEQGTNCTGFNVSFKEQGQERQLDINHYYDYLDSLGPTRITPTCDRRTPLLASIDQSFKFYTTNIRTTGDGYVDYVFALRGHYDPKNLTKWLGSHKTFRLKTTNDVVPTASLTVIVQGNGSVSSGSNEISACTSAGGICTATFQTGTPVQLTATPFNASDTTFWTTSCQDGRITVNNNVSCSVTFSTVNQLTACFTPDKTSGTTPLSVKFDTTCATGNIKNYQWNITSDNVTPPENPTGNQPTVIFKKAGTYTISLQVTDEFGNTSTPFERNIVVESTPPSNVALTADFEIKTTHLESLDPVLTGDVLGGNKVFLSMSLEAAYPDADNYDWYVLQKMGTLMESPAGVLQDAFVPVATVLGGKPIQTLDFPVQAIADSYLSVILKVTEGKQSDNDSKEIQLPLPFAKFTITPIDSQTETPRSFTLNATETTEYFRKFGKTITNWQWWSENANATITNNGQETAQITFPADGNYIVALGAYDDANQLVGGTAQVVYVGGQYQKPQPVLKISELNELTVKMDATDSKPATDNPDLWITDYQWFIKDLANTLKVIPDQHEKTTSILLDENHTYQIFLQVTNNIGYTDFTGTDFLQVSQGGSFNAEGSPSSTKTTFLAHSRSFQPSDKIDVSVDIDVDPVDVDQQAKIVTVVMSPDGNNGILLWQKDKTQVKPFNTWALDSDSAKKVIANNFDGLCESLSEAEASKQLTDQLTVTVLAGTLSDSGLHAHLGDYSAWVGYCLQDNTIVFNGSPFTFEVVP